jgi:CDP-diacylglycerol---glycerol-3-phosphate 3-phosphatidyltransferase
MSIPNILTLVRFPLAALFVLLWFGAAPGSAGGEFISPPVLYGLLLGIVVFCEISDLLDGYLARRWDQVSNLGKILDPYADSTFHMTCFICFASGAHGAWYPIWLVLLIYYREVVQGILRKVGAEQGVFIAARPVGKFKTLIQAISCIALLLVATVLSWAESAGMAWPTTKEFLPTIGIPTMWVVVAISLYSGGVYLWHNRTILARSNDA